MALKCLTLSRKRLISNKCYEGGKSVDVLSLVMAIVISNKVT